MDTANRLQGRDFHVTLVWHPLPGRLCVLLPHHRFASIVVALPDSTNLLDRHPRNSPAALDVPRNPDGRRAHQVIMDYLENELVHAGRQILSSPST
ncbi:hypothetical protein [Streptomyces sp. NPDC002057]|uniref:hypothetical protein n=1 Tax=Streptomyces sp. NPDC002057 TaxID=3154664 RepID=UPI00332C3D6F